MVDATPYLIITQAIILIALGLVFTIAAVLAWWEASKNKDDKVVVHLRNLAIASSFLMFGLSAQVGLILYGGYFDIAVILVVVVGIVVIIEIGLLARHLWQSE